MSTSGPCTGHTAYDHNTHVCQLTLLPTAQPQVVRPKKAKLAEAEVQLGGVMRALALKQAELAGVEAKLGELGAQLDTAKAKKAALEVGLVWGHMVFAV